MGLAFLLVPIFWWRVRQRRREFQKNDHPRILVVPILTRIGDLVCASVVFRAIKKHFPKSHLSVVAGAKAMGIIKNNPRIDQLINFNDIPFKGLLGRGRFFKFLGKQKFDYVISLTNAPINNLIAFYSFAPHRIKTIREERSLIERITDMFNSETRLYRDHTFLQAHYLKILEPLGIYEDETIQEVFTSPDGDKKTDTYFERNGIEKGEHVVGICITAGNKIKEWGDERFAELARRIVEKYNMTLVFIGGKGDEERINTVLQKLKNVRASKCTKAVDFSIEELPSLIKRLTLIIGADTGPIYIAHALNVPLIDILGPIDPTEQPPEDERSILVRPPANIKPSSFVLKNPGKPEEHRRAVEATTVDMVWAAVLKSMQYFTPR